MVLRLWKWMLLFNLTDSFNSRLSIANKEEDKTETVGWHFAVLQHCLGIVVCFLIIWRSHQGTLLQFMTHPGTHPRKPHTCTSCHFYASFEQGSCEVSLWLSARKELLEFLTKEKTLLLSFLLLTCWHRSFYWLLIQFAGPLPSPSTWLEHSWSSVASNQCPRGWDIWSGWR